MLKNILKIIGFIALGVLGGIFAEQVLWPYFVERPFFEKYGLEQSPVYVTERKEITIQENVALEGAIEKVQNTVIGIRAIDEDKKAVEGSALIVTTDGLIVTLAELVPQGSNFYFYVNKRPATYQILKRSTKLNLALIKLEENGLSSAGFADMDKINLGERVFLMGNTFGSSTPELIVDEGIIRSFSENYIKTNIVKTEGTAGSALFDIEGNVIGLNMINKNGNILTIPISTIKEFTGF